MNNEKLFNWGKFILTAFAGGAMAWGAMNQRVTTLEKEVAELRKYPGILIKLSTDMEHVLKTLDKIEQKLP